MNETQSNAYRWYLLGYAAGKSNAGAAATATADLPSTTEMMAAYVVGLYDARRVNGLPHDCGPVPPRGAKDLLASIVEMLAAPAA